MINEDDSGNVYLLIDVFYPSARRLDKYVHKYNKEGEFIDSVKIETNDKLYLGLESFLMLGADSRGNIYQLVIKKDGPALLMWEKVAIK